MLLPITGLGDSAVGGDQTASDEEEPRQQHWLECPRSGGQTNDVTFLEVERRTLAADLVDLEDAMARMQSHHAEDIARVHSEHRADAVNLTHYLALRQSDERSLQRRLGQRGLSSLGRCEPHVLATVESVRSALDSTTSVPVPTDLSFEAGRGALDRNTDALFGPRPPGRVPRIMVTLPSEAATDYQLVRHLVALGMDVARINGAHDGPDAWVNMACNVRKASDEVARPCRISMDLPGPKMRTGPLAEGPRSSVCVRSETSGECRSHRASSGWSASRRSQRRSSTLPVDAAWLERRKPGDRGRARRHPGLAPDSPHRPLASAVR